MPLQVPGQSIPASFTVSVQPQVLPAGGTGLIPNGMFLTNGTRVPVGTVAQFGKASDVSTYFGPTSAEFTAAGIYFAGFDNSNIKPGAMLFTQYNQSAVAAYLRGASITGLTLATLGGYSGNLMCVIDGYQHIGAVNLSGSTSYSNAASIIQTAMRVTEPVAATCTLGTISTTTLTVAGTVTGTFAVGQTITGTSVTANSIITALGTGTGGLGTYILSQSSTVGSGELITASATAISCTYDSISGGLVITSGITGVASTAAFCQGQHGSGGTSTTTGTTLTIGGSVTGSFAVGDIVTGTDTTNTLPMGCTITAILTGTGGAGTYTISAAASPGNLSNSTVTAYNVASGIAPQLFLTTATGAVLSQGAALAVPATFMTALSTAYQNWATFTTLFDPDGGSGNTVKLAFATWNGLQNSRYAYVCTDTDPNAATQNPATGSLGYLLSAAGISGTNLNWDPTGIGLAPFVMGSAASVDYTETNGRITFKFRSQSGLLPNVTSITSAQNLIANGYNYYGANATAAAGFIFYGPGSVSGAYRWLDSYINQIWLTNQLQLDLMIFLTSAKSVPYNQKGYNSIESACTTTINQALTFGMMNTGVPLSSSQTANVNASAGANIAPTLLAAGYYFQVLPALPSVRQLRGSPPCTLWYTDGGAVQSINLTSIAIQ